MTVQSAPDRLIDAQGQPHYGRFVAAPAHFNVEDYRNPFLGRDWQRKLRFKRFSFVAISHGPWQIGFAMADLAWASYGFYYCHHREQNTVLERRGIIPLGWQTQVGDLHTPQRFFRHRKLDIEVTARPQGRHVQVMSAGQTLLDAEIMNLPGHQPLYLCNPNGIRGWTFTHKSMALPVSGYFADRGQQVQLNERSLVTLDDSLGYMRPQTEWFWLSWQGWLGEQRLAINAASGVNDAIGNENCLWINGKLYPLPDLIFRPLSQSRWQISSLDGQVDLALTTGWRRHENIQAGLVASVFSQWVSHIEGTLQLGQIILRVVGEGALLEQHYARW